MAAEAPEIPREVFCCICTQDMSEDAVVAMDGFTYHRVCITRWFGTGKRTSPRTGATLDSTDLIANIDMCNLIQQVPMPESMREGQPPVYDESSYTVTDAEVRGDSQGAAPSPSGPADDAYTTSSYTVTVVEGPEDWQGPSFQLTEVDSDATAAVVQSLIADHLGTHVSRVRLRCGDADVNVLSVLPNGSEIQVFAQQYWRDLVNHLSDTKRAFFLDLANERHPEYPELLFCDTAEFSEMLRLQCTLVNGWTTRGAQSAAGESDEEWAEFASVLREARAKPGATPASVLRFLQEEFC